MKCSKPAKDYLREVEDRLWRDHSYERKNKNQTSASRESEEGENQIQIQVNCPKQNLVENLRTDLNSAKSKLEEEGDSDLEVVIEDIDNALETLEKLEKEIACKGDVEAPLNPEGVDSAKPVDKTGEVPPPPEEGE